MSGVGPWLLPGLGMLAPFRLRLRPVVASDLPAIEALETMSYPADEAASRGQLEYRLEKAPEFFRAAVGDDGRIVGFAVGTCYPGTDRRLDEESMRAHDAAGEGPLTLCIHSVVVAPDRRRAGVGTALIADYVDGVVDDPRCTRVAHVRLICKPPLIAMYARAGFHIVGPSPVVHGADEWVEMALASADRRETPFEVVDAFSPKPYCGNPAAVVFVRGAAAVDDDWMQSVAAEFNLAETSFVREVCAAQGEWLLRWFTPIREVEFCGHATLAAAHSLWATGRAPLDVPIRFQTLFAGELVATSAKGDVTMDLPAPSLTPCAESGVFQDVSDLNALLRAIGVPSDAQPEAILLGPSFARDVLVAVEGAVWARLAEPEFGAIGDVTKRLGLRGVILTVRGDGVAGTRLASTSQLHAKLAATDGGAMGPVDFTSRFFAPAYGIDEDPVTGSAHATLAVFWSERLSAKGHVLTAYQASRRGGLLRVRTREDRVEVVGQACTVSRGKLVT